MSEQMIDPRDEQLAAEWLLIMERLRVSDLATWIAQFRAGDRATNREWRSWEAIARLILERTRVSVSANGLRNRWSEPVDAVLDADVRVATITTRADAERAGLAAAWDRARSGGEQPDVPTRDDSVGSTGPAGTSGSEVPAGSNPAEGTR